MHEIVPSHPPSRIEAKNLDQNGLYSCIAALEKSEFPETANNHLLHDEAYGETNNFLLFRPSRHVASGLINPSIIGDLQNKDSSLSS